VVPEYELAWLFKIAQNVCHNRHQSARRRGRVEATQDLDALQDVIASPERSPGVSLGELTLALGAIPARQRRALVLREFEGCSYEEIAVELGGSVAAVETLLFRARRAVAQQLEQPAATSRSQRGAAASSVVGLFRWFFGGAAAPLKLAAVTAAVATTATLSVVNGHKTAPVSPPAIAKHSVVVPAAGKPQPLNAPRTTAHVPAVRGANQQSPAPTQTTPVAPPVHTAPPSTPGPGQVVSPPRVEPGVAPALPPVSLPNLPAPIALPPVTLPPVSIPDLALPAVTLPAVQLPLTSELPKLP
jgi:hypothetical protein